MTPVAASPHPRPGRYTTWLLGHRAAILVTALAATAVTATFAARLRVDTNLIALLPDHAPRVQALREVLSKTGGAGDLMVMIDARRFDDALEYAETLLPDIRALPWVDSAAIGRDTSFFERNQLLYLHLDDLETIERRVDDRLRYERLHRNPLYVDLEDQKPPSLDFQDIESKYRSQVPERKYYRSEDGHILIVVIRPSGTTSELGFVRSSYEQLVHLIARHPPARSHPGMTVSVGGTFKNRLDEYDTIVRDVRSSVAIVAIALVLALWLYFRRLLGVVAIAIPLAMSLSWSFALALAAVGTLNIVTVFLVVVLMGLNIDFGIHMLAGFARRRRDGRSVAEAVGESLRAEGRSSTMAALTTAACFFALTATEFRGFRQLGVIAGSGLLFSIAAYLVVFPALVSLLEEWRPMATWSHRRPGRPGRPLRHPRLVVAASGLLVVLATLIGRHAAFEYDLRNIRSRVAETREFNRKMRTVFPRARDPAVILTDGPEQAHAVASKIARKSEAAGPASPVESVRSSSDLLPRHLDAKLAIIAKLRRQIDDLSRAADRRELERIDSLRSKLDVTPIRSVADLPPELLRWFRGLEGPGELVFVYQRHSLLDLRNAVRFSHFLGRITVGGRSYLPVSEPLVYADLLTLVRRDAPLALGLCFAVLLGLLFADLRSARAVALVLVPLAVGAVLMVGVMALSGTKLNILNAAVLPSLLGLGIDGGVHVYHAARRRGAAQMTAVLRETGGAVAMCTATSIIGFSGMMVAVHPGLRSIAVLAVIGLSTCLFGALVVLPNLLAAIDRRSHTPRATR